MDGRVKHSLETRIEAARLFDAGFGYSAVSSHLGLSKGTTRDWLDSHRSGRLIGLGSVSGNKHYGFDLKVAAVEKFLAGTTKPEILVEFDITAMGLFNKWVAIYRQQGPEGLRPKAKGRKPSNNAGGVETDTQKIARLEFEVEALKKLQALVASEQQRARKR